MAKKVINLTPHPITVEIDGRRTTYGIDGRTARLTESRTIGPDGGPLPGPVVRKRYSSLDGMPPAVEGEVYIVSAMCLPHCIGRSDVVAPATGPDDGVIRGDDGQIIAITRWQLPQVA